MPQALECAFDQTYANLEIIVADNCSTDNTRAIVNGITDPRLRYFRHDVNIGSTANINFCLEQAKGEYVLFLHDDDRIDPDFVESCIRAAMGTSDIGMIRAGVRWIDAEGNVFYEALNRVGGLPIEEFFLGWFNNLTPMHLCSTLFSTTRLKDIGGFNSKHNLFDDVIAEIRMAAKYERVDVPNIRASFRHHSSTLTASVRISNWCEESKILFDLICSLVPESKVALIKSAGLRFFIGHNYRIASKIRSPVGRLMAYATILKQFNYPFFLFISVVISTTFSRQVGYLKLGIKKALEMTGLWLKVDAFRKSLQGSQR